MYRANLVKLYLNKTQEIQLTKTYHAVRFVYNWGLGLKIRYYRRYNQNISQFDLMKQMTKLKKRTKTKWLKEVDALSLQSSIMNLNTAYVNFFRRPKVGFPKFKSVKTAQSSFTAYQTCFVVNNKLKIAKTTTIKMRGLRDDYGDSKIKNITITKRKDNKWVGSLLFELPDIDVNINVTDTIGIDVGIKKFVYDSNNNSYEPVNVTKEHLKIENLQRVQSKQKLRGLNRKKTQLKINRLHQKIKDKKKEQIEQITHKYKGKHCIIEDLNIKSMSKKKPNKTLNRNILQQSWGLFFVRLENKTIVTKVDPAYTSQMCSRCKYTSKENRENQASFLCKKCNLSINADYNASINILNLGNPEDCLESTLS